MRFADIQVIMKKTLVFFSNKLERWQKIANIKGSPKKKLPELVSFSWTPTQSSLQFVGLHSLKTNMTLENPHVQ